MSRIITRERSGAFDVNTECFKDIPDSLRKYFQGNDFLFFDSGVFGEEIFFVFYQYLKKSFA